MFGKLRGFPWWPGKIVQNSDTVNNNSDEITCYWFGDNNISELSKDKLSSFFNYGSKVDFKKLKTNQRYRNSILIALKHFAEIHRPNLLTHEDEGDKDSLLLDWARLGFAGCPGLNKRKATERADDENKDISLAFASDDEVDISLPPAKRKELSEITVSPLHDNDGPSSSHDLPEVSSPYKVEERVDTFAAERNTLFEKERTPSCDTIDSGYNSTSPSCSPILTLDDDKDDPLTTKSDELSFSFMSKSISETLVVASPKTKSPYSSFLVNPAEFEKLVFGKLKKFGWWPAKVSFRSISQNFPLFFKFRATCLKVLLDS